MNEEFHLEVLRQFDQIQTALKNERLQCLDDRRFATIPGAQWEGPLGQQFDNKPRFEVNKVAMSVLRIENEYRNNRIGVEFSSKDGEEKDSLADVCAGLHRADEQDSCAEEAQDNAFSEAVHGGMGAWRLRAEYENEEDEEDEKQRIRFEPIFDADSSVYFDLDAKRQDKSDARHCFLLISMTPEAYRNEYGEDPVTINKEVTRVEFDWYTPDVVFVAEYYVKEMKTEVVRFFENTLTGEEESFGADEYEEKKDSLASLGWKEVRQRKVKRRKIHKYIISGNRILEDCGYIAGKHIPIVPVYGKRWFVDNVERCMGHVRLAKDPQRLKNMQVSKLGEIAAFSSIEKPIFTPEQVAGHRDLWAEDNVKNYPFLLINPITDSNGNSVVAPPVAFTKSPDIPQAMAALLQLTEVDMQDILGNQNQGDKMLSHLSSKTVEMVQSRLDMQSFMYMSNMAKAVKRSAEIWLSMAKDVYVEPGRKMKMVLSDGKTEPTKLNLPTISEEGEIEMENDLSEAEYDVVVTIGPTSATKRQATVRALTNMMSITQDQEMLQVLSAMAMMNMEGEGIADVRDYFRKKLLRMGVLKPTELEQQELIQELQNQPPDPQQQYLEAASEQALAQATKSRTETILTLAKAEETRAKTAETLSKVSNLDQDRIFGLADRIGQAVQRESMAPPMQ
jgi:hypothetical protein